MKAKKTKRPDKWERHMVLSHIGDPSIESAKISWHLIDIIVREFKYGLTKEKKS